MPNLAYDSVSARSLLNDDRGLTTVEYVVLLVLIVAMCVVTWNKFGKDVSARLDSSEKAFSTNVNVPKQ